MDCSRFSLPIFFSHSTSRVLRLSDEVLGILDKLWKSPAPFKVVAFSWQLLLDRVPAWTNQFSRGVIMDAAATVCILCRNAVESCLHLFYCCSFSFAVCYTTIRWLGFDFVMQ